MRIAHFFGPLMINPRPVKRFNAARCRVVLAIGVATLVGCDGSMPAFLSKQPSAKSRASAAMAQQDAALLGNVVAQGKLEPAGGVLALMAPPGDRVARVAVVEGQSVEAGELLVELESLRAKKIELDVAEIKLEEGRARLAAEEAAANARLQVARTKLKQAETQLQQSKGKLQIAESPGGSLELLRRAAELGDRKLDQLRSASTNPSTQRLVSENKLEEESLRISETRAQYETARAEASDAIESAELAVEAARQDIVAAEKSMEAAQASASLQSLEKQIELLRLNLETAHLLSPTSGRILDISATSGQATTTMPLMHLADTGRMVCVAEVNVADLDRLAVGQPAEITSPGLSRTLRGTVSRVHHMIMTPQMPSPFPTAPVDRYTANVTIEIAPEDVAVAAERIQMQVDVTISMQSEMAEPAAS